MARARGRLPRPPIPLPVKLTVALRDLGELTPEQIAVLVKHHRGRWRGRLRQVLQSLARKLGCEVTDLRLDHDPPLGARQKIWEDGIIGGKIIGYVPDANNPDHLGYRPHATTFDGSHDVKTRIRGEHGQHSDIVRIKRQRRLEREEAGLVRPRAKIRSGAKLTSCTRRGGCQCDRRQRRRCSYWHTQKINSRRS